uniref:NADH-ubiquinone oxidoreductase chain 2 n=1 Tax=Brachystomella parvula TaxID=187611 RepID=A0A650BJW9_9HEXA|nr:NADH dehydrogenase subunit 2 [Brachystomella parvula]
MLKNKMFIFFPSLILGTLMAISASSWFTAWMGLEINLMSMTPIIINKINFLTVEASIKYFLIQAMSSLILIFSSFLSYTSQKWGFLLSFDNMYFMSLSLKAGIAPLHFWFPQVIMCSNWIQCMVMLTWQKIAPFILMSYLNSKLMSAFIISSALIGTLGGMNQINIKMILVYSSIINSAWMLSLSSTNEIFWWMYFLSYTFMTFSASYVFIKISIEKISSLHKMSLPSLAKIVFLMNFLSLAGLPPFLGFFIKIMAINMLMENNMNLLTIIILITTSILSFYFYLRTSYSSLFINETSLSIKSMVETTVYLKIIFLLSMFSSLGILMIPPLTLLT